MWSSPVVMQRQVQKTVGVPQIQSIDNQLPWQSNPCQWTPRPYHRRSPSSGLSPKKRSFESGDQFDLDARSLVQGEEHTQEVEETDGLTQESDFTTTINELVQVAPRMGAGGSHHQATMRSPSYCGQVQSREVDCRQMVCRQGLRLWQSPNRRGCLHPRLCRASKTGGQPSSRRRPRPNGNTTPHKLFSGNCFSTTQGPLRDFCSDIRQT